MPLPFVSVDSGFNHLIRPMFYDAYHRIENISNPTGTPKHYSVVGNICETDTFAWDRTINEVREGDYLVFYNAGAYGFEMSSNFNSRYKPAEVLVKENGRPPHPPPRHIRRPAKKPNRTLTQSHRSSHRMRRLKLQSQKRRHRRRKLLLPQGLTLPNLPPRRYPGAHHH